VNDPSPAREANAPAPPPFISWQAAATLLAMMAATTILSQFFRASTSVIGPELIRDLSLSPKALGFASGSFFLALLLPQIFVGVLFDRIGPRITVSALSVFMVAGALLHALAETGAGLALARFVVGLGCAGSFMSAVVLVSRWYPRHSWSTALSWVFALSQIGFFLAGLPLAAASELIGWRSVFVGMAAVAAVVGALFFWLVRDRPPGSPPDVRQEQLGPIEGVRRVLATPGLLRVLALFLVAYAAFAAVVLLWAGPYLNDVHGLDPIARGQVLLGMAVVQTLAGLAIGPLDRLFNTRKWVAVGNAAVALATLTAFAVIPGLSTRLAIFLLLLLSSASAYGSVMLAHIRSHFPDHLAGRGATTGNMVQLIGAAMLSIVTGFIPALVSHGGPGYSPLAYRWIFATLATALAMGLAVYLTAKDSKPRSSAAEPAAAPMDT
jgi:MFS family permease